MPIFFIINGKNKAVQIMLIIVLALPEKKDFLILPEIFAHLAEDMCIKNDINYAIFAQNGYVILSTNNERKLSLAYKKAKFIISYSDDITNCIKLKFPNIITNNFFVILHKKKILLY